MKIDALLSYKTECEMAVISVHRIKTLAEGSERLRLGNYTWTAGWPRWDFKPNKDAGFIDENAWRAIRAAEPKTPPMGHYEEVKP